MSELVTIGATHEVKIDGLSSWIKCEVTLEKRESETIDETWEAASNTLAQKVIAEIEKQARLIVEANKKQKEV